jgi:UDP-glucose 4-epimerase
MNVLNEAVRARVACFVFTSSIAVYGFAEPPVREDAVPAPAFPRLELDNNLPRIWKRDGER